MRGFLLLALMTISCRDASPVAGAGVESAPSPTAIPTAITRPNAFRLAASIEPSSVSVGQVAVMKIDLAADAANKGSTFIVARAASECRFVTVQKVWRDDDVKMARSTSSLSDAIGRSVELYASGRTTIKVSLFGKARGACSIDLRAFAEPDAGAPEQTATVNLMIE